MQPTIDRDPRVRFKHPVRVVPIGGPPRAYRVLASNLSKEGMFLRMPTPFDAGTKVALSLEAGGRVLPFAQAEVVWKDLEESKAPGRGAGFAVRFTGFLHPRAHELVDYLVANLETGKPLRPPEPVSPGRKRRIWIAAGLAAVVLGAGVVARAVLTGGDETPTPAIVVAVPQAAPLVVEDKLAAPPLLEAPEVLASPVLAAIVDVKPESAPKVEVQSWKIPSGSIRAMTASLQGPQLELVLTLAPGASVTRAFALGHPDRVAFDVRGAVPKLSYALAGTGVVSKVRVGKLPHGTRIVIDLSRPPGRAVVVSGTTVLVPLR